MPQALLVNPYDTPAMADSIERALRMPLAERIERYRLLLETVEKQDVRWWLRSFLAALQGSAPAAQALAA
jgi:trehalose 6-phosphate synthase